MRRSPFKFFFALSIGVILFFFLARVFVVAFLMAAVLSLGFFLVRKIKNFFKNMNWEDEDDYRYGYHQNQNNIPFWKMEEESFFHQRAERERERIIIIS